MAVRLGLGGAFQAAEFPGDGRAAVRRRRVTLGGGAQHLVGRRWNGKADVGSVAARCGQDGRLDLPRALERRAAPASGWKSSCSAGAVATGGVEMLNERLLGPIPLAATLQLVSRRRIDR